MSGKGVVASYSLYAEAPAISMAGTAFGALFLGMNVGLGMAVWCAFINTSPPPCTSEHGCAYAMSYHMPTRTAGNASSQNSVLLRLGCAEASV
jgi:hypothetical protein|eukprot:COSAG06_NODE_14468_length_1154_cov_1.137441_1_plen_93_part_00